MTFNVIATYWGIFRRRVALATTRRLSILPLSCCHRRHVVTLFNFEPAVFVQEVAQVVAYKVAQAFAQAIAQAFAQGVTQEVAQVLAQVAGQMAALAVAQEVARAVA